MNPYIGGGKREPEDAAVIERRGPQRSVSRNSVLATVGNTPLLRIREIGAEFNGFAIFAKAEWFNPGGSVKDRAALRMILDAEQSGALTKNKTLVDATSGNTGIAYAMIGAVLGYKVTLALPDNAGQERKTALLAYGAEIIPTDPLEGTDGAQRKVKEMVAADPEKYFYPDQYNNESNWKAHYDTTALEIWEQTKGKLTHFVAGLGTSGTFVGTSRRLKELNPGIRCISFQPDSPLHGLEGLKHMDTSIVPGIYDESIADEEITVSTEEAYEMVRCLGGEEGLFVGISSGAAMAASLRVAAEVTDAVIVTIFPDSGARYGAELFSKNVRSKAGKQGKKS